MKVLHVISGISRMAGGPSRSSQGLVAGLRAADVDAWLMTIKKGDTPWIKGVEKFINGGDFLAIVAAHKPDIVHIHGVWDPALHRCAVICRKKSIPYVIAPRGMLEPWSLKAKWLKKRIARFLYQDHDLKKAAALHATAEIEAAQFRALGFKNYCIISPNGVNVPEKKIGRESRSTKECRALFVSRMHPKKGVLELVESWARVKPAGWQCELVYTLNGDTEKTYEAQVKQRILELGMSYQDKDGTVHSSTSTRDFDFILTGALDDEKKWEAYARADLFMLPTYSENFGIVVAEALWAGVPVITTKGTPWQDLVGFNCGWWIDLPSPVEEVSRPPQWSALDAAIQRATKSPALTSMGQNGHRLVEEKYTWSAVCKAMVHGYEQILNACENAPCDTCRSYGDTCPIK